MFETLYYCGLRNGEMRGLTWKDIDFNNKQIIVNKQIPTRYTSKNWKFTTPKTNKSRRNIPMCNTLYEDLSKLYNKISQHSNFNESWFVFGEANIPIVAAYLGHTKVEETLNTYTHLFNSALDSVINVINNVDKIQNSQSNDVIDTITDLCNNGVTTNDIINQLKNIKIQENKR